MAKTLSTIVGLSLLVLLWPRYNLYEKDGWSERYLLRQKGFWSQGACEQAGRQLDDQYLCRKTSTWQGFWGKQEAHGQADP